MRRVVLLTSIVIMAAGVAWGGIAKIKAPELKTEKLFGDSFSTEDYLEEEEGIIGFYRGISIEWPTSMEGIDVTNLQNAVGKFTFGDKFTEGASIDNLISRRIEVKESLPVPYEINNAFYNSKDFSWLYDGEIWNFHFDLQLVQVIDKVDGAYVSYSNSYSGWSGGVSHIFYYYMMYDLVNDEPLEYSDIFVKGHDNEIIKMIVAQLMKDNKAKTYEQLKEDLCFMIETEMPPLPKNIVYDKGNFIFSYNPYEIACGASECITAVIPAKKLQKFMTSRAKTLFKVK
ncbi:MAG: DUF3298 domain-containing protein [Muribaculaceae bacterium]|nr:DUF3298 domain-containing protein [Muribaculaceae bacterium]